MKISRPTETEQCTETLTAVFQKDVGEDRNNCRLSNRKLPNFLNTELAVVTENQKDIGVLDHMMKKLDLNCDGQLEF